MSLTEEREEEELLLKGIGGGGYVREASIGEMVVPAHLSKLPNGERTVGRLGEMAWRVLWAWGKDHPDMTEMEVHRPIQASMPGAWYSLMKLSEKDMYSFSWVTHPTSK